MPLIALLLGLILGAGPARADIAVRFVEGAPKDRFIVENLGDCALGQAVVTIDLAGSRGGLIFDVTGAGAGVSVFQPFEVESGGEFLGALRAVSDGDTSVALPLRNLPPAGRIVLTTDLDDTVGRQATIVADAEIAGAAVAVEARGARISSYFGANAAAMLAVPPCPSA